MNSDFRTIDIPRNPGDLLRIRGRLVDQVRTPRRGDDPIMCEVAAYTTEVGVAIVIRVIQSDNEIGTYAAEAEKFTDARDSALFPAAECAKHLTTYEIVRVIWRDVLLALMQVESREPFTPPIIID